MVVVVGREEEKVKLVAAPFHSVTPPRLAIAAVLFKYTYAGDRLAPLRGGGIVTRETGGGIEEGEGVRWKRQKGFVWDLIGAYPSR